MPPSRYKVVERGRRLIVVDTRTGVPVTGMDPGQQARIDQLRHRLAEPGRQPARTVEVARDTRARPVPPPPSSMSSQSGSIDNGPQKILTTQSWFDERAPRRVVIDEEKQGMFAVVIAVIVVVALAGFFLFDWFWLVALAFVLINPGARKGLRKAMTKWLDGLRQA